MNNMSKVIFSSSGVLMAVLGTLVGFQDAFAESDTAAVAQSKAHPALEALGNDEWYAAQNMPSPGAVGSHAGAYSSFVVDTSRGRVLKRGGGHCDYRGTEVQEFDTTTTLSWSIADPTVPDTEFLPADHFDNNNFPGAVVVLPDGSAPSNFAAAVANRQAVPITRHTTNATTFIESTGEFFLAGAYTYGESGGSDAVGCSSGRPLHYTWSPPDAWAYDPRTTSWRYLANHNADMEWAGCVWVAQGTGVSDSQGAVFCITEQDSDMHRYDVGADSWSIENRSVPGTGLGINLTYAERFRSLYYYWNGRIWRYELSSENWSQVSTSGSAGTSNGVTAYDSTNDAIGVWDGDRLYLCEMSSQQNCTWTSATTANSPRGGSGGGVSSNFAYDPVNNVFWAANAQFGTVYFGAYRFKGGSGTPLRTPSAINDLQTLQ